MLTHHAIWSAIDSLAARHNSSVSALARRAGLDPTSFNKSKRFSRDGRERWPSTESVAKVLDATGDSVDEFMALIGAHSEPESRLRPIALLGFAQAGSGGFFDDSGFPAGGGWDEVRFPDIGMENVYALEISGDSMLPLYRDGDRVIVSPTETVRRGDRVVIKTQAGEIMAKILKRRTSTILELQSLNPEHEDRVLEMSEVDWIARIIWASQ